MKIFTKSLFFFCFILSACAAHAAIFMCKDATGRTITSDRPIPECADRAVKELGTDGLVRHEIARPLTPEEKRQQKADEEKRLADAAVAEEQKKSDRLLMARYSSEKDIETARKRAMTMAGDQLKIDSSALAVAEKALDQVRAELDAAKKKPAGPSADLRRRAEEAEQAVKDGRKAVQDREAANKLIDVKFDETLKRYRELTGVADAKPVAEKKP